MLSSLSHAEAPATNQIDAVKREALCAFPPVRDKPIIDPKLPSNQTHLQADEADMSKKDVTHFSGNVVIQREGRRIEANNARYSQKNENFDASGNVRFLTEEIEVHADKTNMNLKENRGTLQQTRYRTLPENASGSAEKITVDGPKRLIMEDATYTTCPPNNMAWELSANEITLDKESRRSEERRVGKECRL